MKQNVRQSIARLTERNIPFDINSRLKRHSNMKIYITLVVLLAIHLCSARFLIRDGPGNARCPAIGQHDLTDDNRFNINRDFKADIENETGQQYICLKPIYFAKQMVSGFLYYVKVCATDRENVEKTLEVKLWEQPWEWKGLKFRGVKTLWDGCSKLKPKIYSDDY